MAAPRINPLHGVKHPGSSENGDFVFCEHSTSPLVISKALMEAVCNQVGAVPECFLTMIGAGMTPNPALADGLCRVAEMTPSTRTR